MRVVGETEVVSTLELIFIANYLESSSQRPHERNYILNVYAFDTFTTSLDFEFRVETFMEVYILPL